MHIVFVNILFLCLAVDVWCMNRKALISSTGSKRSSRGSGRDNQKELIQLQCGNSPDDVLVVEKCKIFKSLVLRDCYEKSNKKEDGKKSKKDNKFLVVSEINKDDVQLWGDVHNYMSKNALQKYCNDLLLKNKSALISTLISAAGTLRDNIMTACLYDICLPKDMRREINKINAIKPVIKYLMHKWVTSNIITSSLLHVDSSDSVKNFVSHNDVYLVPCDFSFAQYSGEKCSAQKKEIFNNTSSGFATVACAPDDICSITLSDADDSTLEEIKFNGCAVSGLTFSADDSKVFCFVEKDKGVEIMAWDIHDVHNIVPLPMQFIPLNDDCIENVFYCSSNHACIAVTAQNHIILIDNIFNPSLIMPIEMPSGYEKKDNLDFVYAVYSDQLKWWFVLLSTNVKSSLYVFDMMTGKTVTTNGMFDGAKDRAIRSFDGMTEGIGLLSDGKSLIVNFGGGAYRKIALLSEINKYSLDWIENKSGVFDNLLLQGLYQAFLYKNAIEVNENDVVYSTLMRWVADDSLARDVIRHFVLQIGLPDDKKESLTKSFGLRKCTVQ